MTMRAFGSKNPTLSVATNADLQATNTSYLKDGDLAFVDASGLWFFTELSSASPSSTILATANSGGGTLPGRWIFTGIGPGGGGFVAAEFYRDMDAIDANAFGEGTRLYLIHQHSTWILHRGPANSGNEDEVRQALSTAPKYWERIVVGSPEWYADRIADDGVVYIDSVTGSDDNDGSSTSPFLTLSEFVRRTLNIQITDDIEVDIAGADAYLRYPLRPTTVESASVIILGALTPVGSGPLTAAVNFNRATNVAQEYTATIAGHPLTNYTLGASSAYYITSDTGEGWILGAAAPPSVFANTYSGNVRSSTAGPITLSGVATFFEDDITVDAANCFIQIEFLGFNHVVQMSAGPSEQIFLSQCAFLGSFFASGRVNATHCAFNTFVKLQNASSVFAACAIGGLISTGSVTSASSGLSFDSPSFFGGSGITISGGALTMSDVMVKVNGTAFTLAQCVLTLTSYAWGPNTGGANGTFILSGPSTFVSCADFTKIYATGAGGGQRLARLTTASGTNTDIANQAALTASVTGIRNSNAFIGFVN